ncbi:DUF6207 family protein [Streptomyces coeruleorubidus]|uniref:DUF6207 family protein n=1 Tax=Streptomyces coeruleorubidus TaxID=116188 RepID=UPI001E305C42|nr:DUF6207 family protein [Streptomyces coeruleorubidus]
MRCGRWATATSDRTTRDPGQLSVRLRCLDVRHPGAQRTARGEVLWCADLPWSGW